MKIMDTVAAELTKRQNAAVVAVSDSYGELIALLRIGDVPLSVNPPRENLSGGR
jgi:hypothetical protein